MGGLKKFVQVFFYGNIFLGVYAVALCIETNLINHLSLNTPSFYLLIFFCTCIYYTMIYARSLVTRNPDARTLWYKRNSSVIITALKLSVLAVIFLSVLIFVNNPHGFLRIPPFQYLLLIAFLLIAAWYTYSPTIFRIKKIRQTGWIKPFVVGFIWAGWVIVFPVVFLKVQGDVATVRITRCILLFLQNFLLFSINAIIFDVKDYGTDLYHRLKTFPVILGINKTVSFVIIPLLILNMAVFFVFQIQQQFGVSQTLIQLIPYLLLVFILTKLNRKRSLLYYLAAVDGIVIVKAICGITSILFFKE